MSKHDIIWCKQLFAGLVIGGVWGVPRSGLIFRKKSRNPPIFELFEVMPYDPAMPMSAEELKEYQQEDFLTIKEKFAEAGITVIGDI